MERQEEKLIEMVRVYPVLYDTSDCNYMKSKYKQEIWARIATELNIADVEEVKSAWKKLRNNHRDALRRHKRMMKSGPASTYIKPWRFQAQMEFLLQYMVNENRETSFTTDDYSSEPQLREQDNQPAEETQEVETNITEIIEIAEPDTADVEMGNSAELSVNEPAESQPPHKKFKKYEVEDVIVKAIERREQRATQRDRERKKLAPSDDLQLFFMSMYELTKKMPPSSQHIVRRNVFLSVTEEEARLLNIQEPTCSPQQPLREARQPRYDNWSRLSDVVSCPETSASATSATTSPDGTINRHLPTSSLASFINALNP